jgi:1,4-alpha-glucan branching enzyme
MAKKIVRFKLYAPQARRVSLAGNFNNWDTNSLFAKKDKSGDWIVSVNLNTGKYEYKFVVDGSWMNDPACKSCVPNNVGSTNCVLVVK